jgi:hypothetical protein
MGDVCMVKNKFLTATIILSILTVMVFIWNITLATNPNPSPTLDVSPNFDINEVNPTPVVNYEATAIPKPNTYWNLTAPDPYILLAISNLGTWIPCRENETTFLEQVKEHNDTWKIRYQENYYEIEALWSVSPHPTPNVWVLPKYKPIHLIEHTTEHVASALILGVLWCPLIIIWKRRKPIQ